MDPYGQIDYEWNLKTLDGEAVSFESFRGKTKTVLLNHWATWCGPCVAGDNQRTMDHSG